MMQPKKDKKKKERDDSRSKSRDKKEKKEAKEKDLRPATYTSRSGITMENERFAASWHTIDFQGYEGMTQMEFQDAQAPYNNGGKYVEIIVPKGWRRVEGGRPGKHFYVNMPTGAMTKIPKELWDPDQESWVTPTGEPITLEELEKSVYIKAMEERAGGGEALVIMPKEKTSEKTEKKAPKKAAKKKAAPKEAVKAATDDDAEEIVMEPEKPKLTITPKDRSPPLPVGLLFPGQGSQYVKMLSGVKELPGVKAMMATAKSILGYDLLELCLKGPESKLEQTRYCQPAMYVGGLAAIEKLKADNPEKVDRCQACAGLSLGEYTALTVAGVFDFETCLRVVQSRGEAMHLAAEASKQSMLSVAGLKQDVLEQLCKESRNGPDEVCQIANFLFPNGFSCAGTAEAIERLKAKADKTVGCLQAKILKTSGGFHTPLMASARKKLMDELKAVEKDMKPPRCDVYMNVTGHRITPDTKPAEIIELLANQLVSCVVWEPAVREMIKDGVTEFYECGPMKQLKAMMKRIDTPSFQNTFTIDV